MAIGRRRLFGLLAGAPPAAVAALSASLAAPEVAEAAPDPSLYVFKMPFEHNRGIAGFEMNAVRRRTYEDRMADHTCQCPSCTPGIMRPDLKVLSREYYVPFADQGDTEGYWREEYEPLHDGHFGVRIHRPTYQDHEQGVRLKILVNGHPISSRSVFEVIAGPSPYGRVWKYTDTPDGHRHSCLTCSKDACVTFYQGDVEVQVMIPDHATLSPAMQFLVKG